MMEQEGVTEIISQPTDTLQFDPNSDTYIKKGRSLKLYGLGLVTVTLLTLGFIIFAYSSERARQFAMPPTPTPHESAVISTYPLLSFDEIEIDDSIPQYPNSAIVAKLKGRNDQNQDITYLEFGIPGRTELPTLVEFFQTKLPEKGWNIQESKGKKCSGLEEAPCAEWHIITAAKPNRLIEFSDGVIISAAEVGTGYTIKLLEDGESASVKPELSSDFPHELIPPETEIQMFLEGLSKDGFGLFLLEVENFSYGTGMFEKVGWTEGCGYTSTSTGTAFYGCDKNESSVRVLEVTGENHPKRQTYIYVKFPYPTLGN